MSVLDKNQGLLIGMTGQSSRSIFYGRRINRAFPMKKQEGLNLSAGNTSRRYCVENVFLSPIALRDVTEKRPGFGMSCFLSFLHRPRIDVVVDSALNPRTRSSKSKEHQQCLIHVD
jgi:hypothetical protein